MAEKSEITESIRIAHLSMLQGVISRMGANCFALKALSAAFGSAALAALATAQNPSIYYASASAIPIFIFWLMDAQFLRYERSYRRLFDRVRKGDDIEAYTLNAEPFMDETANVFRIAVSWSVAWFYLAILISLGVVAGLILLEN